MAALTIAISAVTHTILKNTKGRKNMSQQRVLVLDIETSPLLVYVWQLKDNYIAPNQIKTDWQVLAWAAKWLDAPAAQTMYRDLRGAKTLDDKKILAELRNLLDKADIVLTQNGREFDSKKLNARFIIQGIKPPSPYKHWDTYQLVSKVASFTSNSLEYLTAKLNKKYRKLSHKKFPGLELWKSCLAGDVKAWNEMRTYNIHDVLSTEELYFNLRAWAPEAFPRVYNFTDAAKECGTCGHRGRLIEGRVRVAKKYKYRQHACPKCGAWQKGERVK